MKSTSSFLWRLIRTMTANEKVYFKRNFAASGSRLKPLYLQLFDAVAAQKIYNEDDILRKLKPGLNKKNIAFQKYYLQQQVCKAIAGYDNRNSSGHDIYNQILLIRVYRKKGLIEEAHATWKKAVSQARNSESYALLHLLKTEFEKMVLFSSELTSYDELHTIFKSNIITYSEYSEMITLRDIYTEILLLKRKSHFDLDPALHRRVAQLRSQVRSAHTATTKKSFWLRHYYTMSKATLLYLSQNHKAAFSLLQQMWSDWKKNKVFTETSGEFYIELLYMINYAGISTGNYSYVMEIFNDPLNDGIKEDVLRANFEVIKFLALNRIYNKTAQYSDVSRLSKATKIKLSQWEPLLNTDLNRTAYLSLGIAFFVLEQYTDAFSHLKRGLTYFKQGTRNEHTTVANILLLLTVYCMNNPALFDAQYQSTYQYFYKRNKKQPCETALLQCIRRTFYLHDNHSKIAEYQKALVVLDAHKNEVVQKQMLSMFNYHGWLLSRTQNISYRQFVEHRVGERKKINQK